MPESDYYDYAAQVHLHRPIVLTGYLTEFTRAVSYRASILLGLPYHDIERLIEHDAGADIGRIVHDRGVAAWREMEANCLSRVLSQRPPGLIALGDGGLLDPSSLERVESHAKLVTFDFDLHNIYWRARQLTERSSTAQWHPLFEGSPESPDELRPFFSDRAHAFSDPDLRIDANGLEPAAAGELVMDWLQSEQ